MDIIFSFDLSYFFDNIRHLDKLIFAIRIDIVVIHIIELVMIMCLFHRNIILEKTKI